jgi:polar amino acid transport system permease protein
LQILSLVVCPPIGRVVIFSNLRLRGTRLGSVEEARAERARIAKLAWFGVSLGILIWGGVFAVAVFVANDHAVLDTFFDVPLLRENLPYMLQGFWVNIEIFTVCEICILVWALIVAVVRELPGWPAAPVRLLAIVYTDLFRGVPSLLVLLIVGLGLRRTGLPIVSEMSDFEAACVALTLNYGAYMSEVIRAGLHSVHWSQAAAARSLGLSYWKTMRFVVLPQAFRHIVPPLLNGFISLQKDSSLVTILGVLDSVNRAQAISSYSASLTPYTGVALFFLVITVPMTRFTDYLIAKDRARRLSRS